jgi:hypothetical protein
MLPVRKIYIDSRFKSPDSASDSDFKVDLPQSLTMPEGSVFFVDDVSIPVSWYVIDDNRNNKLYVRVDGVTHLKTVTPGNYTIQTLSEELNTKLNEIVQNDGFIATPNVSTNQITIAIQSTETFELLTDSQLQQLGYKTPLNTVNSILSNYTSKVCVAGSPFVSSYVDLFPIRNLYVVSPNLGNYNTLSVSGESGIVKKVPVTSGYNEMIFDQVVLGSDFLDCGRQTLRRLEFKLNDVFGNVVNLNGNHWSFSIVFARKSLDE